LSAVCAADVTRGPGEAGSVATIGVFDGVHRGHQRIIARVVDRARSRGRASAVVTFDPSPAEVLARGEGPGLIEPLQLRLARIAALGVDLVEAVTFDEARARESATAFIGEVLKGPLDVREVVAGEDFRFGHGREGDAATLRAHGIAVETMSDVGDGGRFSSSIAREHIRGGDVAGAREVLGHFVALVGRVVPGDARGEQIGFRTANLELPTRQIVPGDGVYAGAGLPRGAGVAYPAAVSIGRRPQFYDHGERLVEAHLIGYDGDLYGEDLLVVLTERLRDQRRFADVAALGAQISRDVDECVARFGGITGKPDSLLGFPIGQRR
jgi:riboflavin kinase/FMN adenylyltransferase